VGVSTEVLIELDAAPVAPVSVGPPAQRYRTFGLVVAVLLVLALAGAVPEVSPQWRRGGLAATAWPDVAYEVAGDRLYVSVVFRGDRAVTGYSVQPFRALWTAHLPAGDGDRLELQPLAGRLLVRVTRSERGPSTTALDARTGAQVWTVPHEVTPLPGGRTGLVQEQEFRAGDEYDESSKTAGPLYFSETGRAYGWPPGRTVLYGIDLADGRERWSAPWAGSIFAAPGSGRPATVVVVSAEKQGNAGRTGPTVVQLLDADTGVVRSERRVAAETVDPSTVVSDGGTAVNAEVVDDALVLTRFEQGGSVRTAYALADLGERWRLRYRDVNGMSRFCAGVPCVETVSGLSVLDPVTGAVRWKAPGATDLTARGGHALELDTSGSVAAPMRTVDAATGVPRVDLSGWTMIAAGAPGAPLVLAAPGADGGTSFGVLRSGERAVRIVGRSAGTTSDCRADARLVACRGPAGVEVFEYRS
jgi:outer membrane protein assembly factor BamB